MERAACSRWIGTLDGGVKDVWRIRDWNRHFENNRTRDLKSLQWVPIPNKQDGDGYTELIDHPNGAAHYGVWIALVLVASKCDPRGTLVRDGCRVHDIGSIARVTRIPAETVREAVGRLINPIHWLEEVSDSEALATIPQESAAIPHEGAGFVRESAQGMEWNGMEGKGMEWNGIRSQLNNCATHGSDLFNQGQLVSKVRIACEKLLAPMTRKAVAFVAKALATTTALLGEEAWNAALADARNAQKERSAYLRRVLQRAFTARQSDFEAAIRRHRISNAVIDEVLNANANGSGEVVETQ